MKLATFGSIALIAISGAALAQVASTPQEQKGGMPATGNTATIAPTVRNDMAPLPPGNAAMPDPMSQVPGNGM